MSGVRCGSAKSGNLAQERRRVIKHELAVCRRAGAVIECDVHVRLRVEYERSACDNCATAAIHGILDLQRAAVRCFQDAIVGDGVACFKVRVPPGTSASIVPCASLTSIKLPSPMPIWPVPEMVLLTFVSVLGRSRR